MLLEEGVDRGHPAGMRRDATTNDEAAGTAVGGLAPIDCSPGGADLALLLETPIFPD
jgi:hypothetical protein